MNSMIQFKKEKWTILVDITVFQLFLKYSGAWGGWSGRLKHC